MPKRPREDKLCSICRENINSDDIATLHCNHIFHSKCIYNWSVINTSCPLCREKFDFKTSSKRHLIKWMNNEFLRSIDLSKEQKLEQLSKVTDTCLYHYDKNIICSNHFYHMLFVKIVHHREYFEDKWFNDTFNKLKIIVFD